MKKIIALYVLLFAYSMSFAGTVYQDRFVPAGVCMVDLNGTYMNAALVQDITAGESQKIVEFNVISKSVYKKYTSVRVNLLNNRSYEWEMPLEEAKAKREQFFKIIKDACQSPKG